MCDPVTLGVAAVTAAATTVAAPAITKAIGGGAPAAPSAPAAPAKTDSDVASQAEEERRRMSLSTLGFGANFQDKLGSMGAFQQAPVSRLTLG